MLTVNALKNNTVIFPLKRARKRVDKELFIDIYRKIYVTSIFFDISESQISRYPYCKNIIVVFRYFGISQQPNSRWLFKFK